MTYNVLPNNTSLSLCVASVYVYATIRQTAIIGAHCRPGETFSMQLMSTSSVMGTVKRWLLGKLLCGRYHFHIELGRKIAY